MQLMQLMRRAGLSPSPFSYTLAADACEKELNVRLALELTEEYFVKHGAAISIGINTQGPSHTAFQLNLRLT